MLLKLLPVLVVLGSTPFASYGGAGASASLADLTGTYDGIHRFATLFTAHDVRDRLSTADKLDKAVDWCRKTAVTQVYLETFRDGYQAERNVLKGARERFLAEGFQVGGCVTTTQVGKKSTGWNIIPCYTDLPTQARIQSIFEYTAGLFDEIMIDDFWFTDCSCEQCDAARLSQTVRIADHTYRTRSTSWEDYRGELMLQLSRDRVISAARQVNPRARLIIKYPQWYDGFHERGYDVTRETAEFDRIWVGTETRDYGDPKWGGTVQYEAYFIMRWLGGIGGEKCGGGWFDWLGTTEATYLEQARQTVLAGARTSLLFCYGGLQGQTGPKNIEVLRSRVPELLSVAGEVQRRSPIGIAAYKPPSSPPGREKVVFDFVGMLGFPLIPCHEFPSDAPAAFFSTHAIKDPNIEVRLAAFIETGRPVLVTDGLKAALEGKVDLSARNVRVLPVRGEPKSLLNLDAEELDSLRSAMLKPFGVRFSAPNHVALYLFRDGSWVVENFNPTAVDVSVNGEKRSLGARDWLQYWR